MPRPKKSEFHKLRKKLFIDIPTAAEFFEVTERTIRNWDAKGAPRLAMRLLWEQNRQLAGLHPAWQGFKIGRDGKLYGPNGLRMSAEHLRHWRSIIKN